MEEPRIEVMKSIMGKRLREIDFENVTFGEYKQARVYAAGQHIDRALYGYVGIAFELARWPLDYVRYHSRRLLSASLQRFSSR